MRSLLSESREAKKMRLATTEIQKSSDCRARALGKSSPLAVALHALLCFGAGGPVFRGAAQPFAATSMAALLVLVTVQTAKTSPAAERKRERQGAPARDPASMVSWRQLKRLRAQRRQKRVQGKALRGRNRLVATESSSELLTCQHCRRRSGL